MARLAWTHPRSRIRGAARPVLHQKGPRTTTLPPVADDDPRLARCQSSAERKFGKALIQRGIPFDTQIGMAGGRSAAGGMVVDFELPSLNAVVRIQGDYWHSFTSAKDDSQKLYLQARGRRVIDVWEHDILRRLDWVMENLIGRRAG